MPMRNTKYGLNECVADLLKSIIKTLFQVMLYLYISSYRNNKLDCFFLVDLELID